MILSFKKQFPWKKPTNFKEKILAGTKIHSIREDEKGRWKEGVKVHADTGVRTKNQRRIMESVCVSVQSIDINYTGDHADIKVDGEYLSHGGMKRIAKNDGFDSVDDFSKWFSSDFQGKIIHWTDFKY